MKLIPLSQGKFTQVDDADFDRLNQKKWRCQRSRKTFYAVAGRGILMHREIFNRPENFQIDHINGNGLDNRKSNLRLCSHGENRMNIGPRNGKKLKGFYLKRSKFQAQIKFNGRKISLGTFGTDVEAAHAYDQAAKIYHGVFAKLNFPI